MRSEVSLFPIPMGSCLPIGSVDNRHSPVSAMLARFLLCTCPTPRLTPGGGTERGKRKPNLDVPLVLQALVRGNPTARTSTIQPSPREQRASSSETVQTATDPDAEQSPEVQRACRWKHPLANKNGRARSTVKVDDRKIQNPDALPRSPRET